jgi:hypothetical protein
MDELVLQVAVDSIVPFGSIIITWLLENASSQWYRIQRWWGGPQRQRQILEAYRRARRAVIDGERDNDMRLMLLQDLRAEFRMQYPAYSDLWN